MRDNGAASSTAACSAMIKTHNVFLTHPVLDACACSAWALLQNHFPVVAWFIPVVAWFIRCPLAQPGAP